MDWINCGKARVERPWSPVNLDAGERVREVRYADPPLTPAPSPR